MEMPITRAKAYQKRNRTTHSWYGDWSSGNDVMSRSCPAGNTLEDHMHRARATMASSSFRRPRAIDSTDSTVPKVIRSKSSVRAQAPPSSTASSPGPTTAIKVPQTGRRRRTLTEGDHLDPNGPSSAYSYDGGFFVTANNANKDFFVIDPEWVSEGESARSQSEEGGKEGNNKGAPEGKNKGGPVGRNRGAPPPPKVITWKSYNRSRSAPPPKYRNPITWEDREQE
ncbi:uncharacterized protein [Littorina saxatilis]|uniref:Uncharacterized protein n=1 Tax=Littorina saxatilis TaxID=31220 RepID=A0AAN9C303_9CAEN